MKIKFITVSILIFVLCLGFSTQTEGEFKKPEQQLKESFLQTGDEQIKEIVIENIEQKKDLEEAKMPKYNISLSKELQEYTWNLCNEYKLSYEMVLSLIYQESRFNPKAINYNSNNTYDSGITQINSKYLKYHCKLVGIDYKNFDVFNPYQAIELTVKLLNYYKEHWKEKGFDSEEELFDLVLGSYNMGMSSMHKKIKTSRSLSNKYSRIVLKHKLDLEKYGEFKTK